VCSPQAICVPAASGGTGGGSGFGGGSGGAIVGGAGGVGGGIGGASGSGGTGALGGSSGSGGSGGGFGGSGGSGGTGATGGFGGSGGSGGSGGVNCTTYCNEFLATNCPNDPTLAECVSTCQAEVNAVAGQCASQTAAWHNCAINAATFSCDADGVSVAEGCQSLVQPYIACGVCLFPSTDTCSNCNQSNCCTPMKTFWSDANAYPFLDCITPCTTQPCYDQCLSTFAAAGSKYNAWVQCQTTNCSTQCT
jgi:hypothetical protein